MNRPTQSELRAKGDEVAEAAANAMSRLMPWLGGTDRFRDLFLESFQGVPDRFARFGESNPERLDAMLASMEYTMTSLSHQDIQDMSMVQNTIGPWEGNAADAFYENYVTPFPGINTNHQDLARELALALEAAVAVIDKSRRDVMRIGDGTIEVLNGLERSGGGGDSGWSTALTVVAAVATVASAAAGAAGTGGLSIAFAVMAGGSSVGTLLASPDVQVGGVEPEEVIESMDEALRNVHLAVSDEERILAKSLNDDLTLVTWPDLVLDVPVINDDPTAHLGEFRLPSVVDG